MSALSGPSIAAAGALNTIARIFSQASQLIIFILAARLLLPADFGVFALVSAMAVVLFRVSQAGWPEFIMSWTGEAKVLEQVAMIAFLSGCLAMLFGLGAAVVLHLSQRQNELVLLMALFALWVPLSTLAAAQHGIMVRRDRLSSAAWTLIVGEAAGLAVSTIALLSGVGVLALVYGRLTQQILHVALGYAFTRALPRFGIARPVFRDLLGFFRHILLSRVLTNMSGHAVTFLIGGILGAAAVGYFRAAARITSAALEVIGEPARVLAWARFRGALSMPGGIAAEAQAFYAVIVALALPVFLWIAIFSKEITVGLLGESWAPAAPLVAVLALAQIMQLPAFVTESVVSLTGQLRRMPMVAMANAIVAVTATAIAAPFGLMAVALSQILVQAVFFGSQLWLQRVSCGISWTDVARASSKSAGLSGAIAAGLLILDGNARMDGLPSLLRVAVLTLPAVPIYLALLVVLYPELRSPAVRLLRRLRRSSHGT